MFLSQKGYSKLIGTDVTPGTQAVFSHEGIRDISRHKNIKGELMYNLIFAPAGSEGGSFYELKPHPGAEILTDFLGPGEKPVIPGFLRFENQLGGRVAITAFNLQGNRSSAVYNYKKKELVRETIEWLGNEKLPVFINDHPNIFCICNKSNNGNYMIVTAINLGLDKFDYLSVDVPQEWKNAAVTQLEANGNWMPLNVHRKDNTLSVKTDLSLMKPVLLKLNR